MRLQFTKMHGCGNDYIYINCFTHTLTDPNAVAKRLSDRHFSVGSDGLVMICPSDIADAKMRMFNADGSEGPMCGNAIRCVGKYLYDSGLVKKKVMTVDTLSGIKTLNMIIKDGVAVGATVEMGRASFAKSDVPVIWDSESTVRVPLEAAGKVFECTALSVGSAHCVCFTDDVASFPLEVYGRALEVHSAFPNRVNIEFIHVVSPTEIDMRVWERGSGETQACGTGACAAAAVAVRLGYCAPLTDITVNLKGGKLIINVSDARILMTGSASKAYDGTVEI